MRGVLGSRYTKWTQFYICWIIYLNISYRILFISFILLPDLLLFEVIETN